MSFMSDFETFSHHFLLKNDKNRRFFACNFSSDLKNAGFINYKFRRLQALGQQDKPTVLLLNSTTTRTGNLSSRLQISFRQSTFGVFLLGMRPFSWTGY
jgi:hypothetical protein